MKSVIAHMLHFMFQLKAVQALCVTSVATHSHPHQKQIYHPLQCAGTSTVIGIYQKGGNNNTNMI